MLRKFYARTDALPGFEPPNVESALSVLRSYRIVHSGPLISARMGLRSCIQTERVTLVELSQRLKRTATIIDKLQRQPTMALSRMHDIAGCRAVLLTQADVERVRTRFMNNSTKRSSRSQSPFQDRLYDYVARPRDTGYRAVHIHTFYGGRRVEVQLRTVRQHAWAMWVESLSTDFGVDFKSGKGEADWLQMCREYADALAQEDIAVHESS